MPNEEPTDAQKVQGPTDAQKVQALKESEERLKLNKKEQADEQKRAIEGINPYRKRPTKYTMQGLTPEQVKELLPYYIDIGPKPVVFGIKRIKWYIARHRERFKLRKELRKQGIKSRREFEQIAREVGLGIDNPILEFLFWLFSWFLGAEGLMTIVGAAALLLTIFFAYSYISEEAGSFTIQLNPETLRSGFYISEDDFTTKTGRLNSDELLEVNAMTLDDIPKDIDSGGEALGLHNGEDFVCYTFEIQNMSDEAQSYDYAVYITDYMFGVEKAVWVMLFEDGYQVIYAALSDDGDPERIAGYASSDGEAVGYVRPPFYSSALNPETQYYKTTKTVKGVEKEFWGIETTPFAIDNNDGSEITVCMGRVENVQPGEKHRYTIAIWLEGYDKECTSDLFGGYAKLKMEFTPEDNDKFDIFKTVYRTPRDPDEEETTTEQSSEPETSN